MAAVQLESAIPGHLTQERTQPLRAPSADYEPHYHAASSRYPESIKDIVVAIFGAQHKEEQTGESKALSKLIEFARSNAVSDGLSPIHWVLASSTDSNGHHNEVLIAYWKTQSDYQEWAAQSGFETWWNGLDARDESNGWFKEIFYPPSDRFETLFSSTDTIEGVGHLQEKLSGPIREHGYWGSMRDRLPISQTEELAGDKLEQRNTNDTVAEDRGRNEVRGRIRVPGVKNLAVIRSGQDWSATTPHERDLYLRTMHPVLIRGMNFLRDEGSEIGCISNRFMEVLDPKTHTSATTDKSFGLGYFDELASLEKWSKSHKTHLDIFGRFLQYVQELGGEAKLKLFHEVLVLEADQQEFEYIGCHPKTGLLATL